MELERKTVTAEITAVQDCFLKEIVRNKDEFSKSEVVRKGIDYMMEKKGYNINTGRKEAT